MKNPKVTKVTSRYKQNVTTLVVIAFCAALFIGGMAFFVFSAEDTREPGSYQRNSEELSRLGNEAATNQEKIDAAHVKIKQLGFMEKCDTEGEDTAYCACMFDSIRYHYGGIDAVGKHDVSKANMVNIPPHLAVAVTDCLEVDRAVKAGEIPRF